MTSIRALSKVLRALGFAAFYLREVLLANLQVAREVVRPRFRMRPAIVAVPLEARTPAEIILLANLITMTPGTLSVDLSTDRSVLYVHALFPGGDAEAFRRSLRERLERRVLEVLR
ncbi:MAG: Na+/H+ antiporter subunit E [Halobacteria archaeon]